MLENLKPEKVFKYFEEICGIPHGSRKTRKISDYLVSFARDRGLEYIQDEHDNVVIYKAACNGYEDSETVIIQGHMDMVCEKTPDRSIDFLNEGLSLAVDGNVVFAEGTTLGGDDGIAVAYMLAILDSDDILHPALECVFTADEEIGLLGAAALDCSVLKGSMLLNIDSEEEGKILTSCAGGATACCKIDANFKMLGATDAAINTVGATDEQFKNVYCIKVDGATGGHSGVAISRQGANAVKVLGRVLYSIAKEHEIRLMYLSGGNKDNAIPRMAYAHIMLDNEADIESVKEKTAKLEGILRTEFRHTDGNIKVDIYPVNAVNTSEYVMDKNSTDRVLAILAGLPNGVIKYSQDIEGLVQTSLNLGILQTEFYSDGADGLNKGNVSFTFSVRSSVGTEKSELIERMECLMKGFGGTVTVSGEYPAWEYKEKSRLRDTMISCYERLYGKEPEIVAIHAGLECGIFAGKIDGLDCVSFGPDIKDIHTTEEKLYIDSVERTWKYIVEVLKCLK